ncbi:MAG: glycoside hydrolase family 43 protein [Chloroflexota bacterium]
MVVVVMAVLVGCATPNGSVGPTSAGSLSAGAPSSAIPSGSNATAAPGSPSPSLAAGLFRNPVIDADFPDPFILADAGRYFAYATTDVSQNLQLARSSDLVTWEMLDDPLPKLPGWSSGDTWAPEVLKTSAGYVLYYTAHDSNLKRPDSSGSQCITLAVSKAPEGPFVDGSDKPLVCQADLGGSIDATAFVDVDKTPWLIWKNDGNCCGLPTRFFMQQLSPDGLSLTGKVTDLGVVNDASWEGSLIEAPTLTVKDGTYYLFYSANGYDTEFYAVGYATAKKVTGPYVDAAENPILKSPAEGPNAARARGPGHQSIVKDDDGELWLAYHAWDEDAVGYGNFGRRAVWIDRLTLEGGKATVAGPTGDPQPVP